MDSEKERDPVARKLRAKICVDSWAGRREFPCEIIGETKTRTDAKGNLIFLGGRGHSSTFLPGPPPGFANNPGWHDDISDGPVDATIQLKDGRTYQAIGAWVITAPPDFAPGVRAFVTGYDLIFETATPF
jgi:L-Lysine epsilon oxidase N-terminal